MSDIRDRFEGQAKALLSGAHAPIRDAEHAYFVDTDVGEIMAAFDTALNSIAEVIEAEETSASNENYIDGHMHAKRRILDIIRAQTK